MARLRSQDALPEHGGLDIAPLLAAQVPELLPLIPADQIEAMQKLYDADASNKELDRRHAQRRSDLASGRVPGVLVDEAGEDPDPNAVKGHYKAVQGPLSFEVQTADVLSDDILQEQPKNKAAEAAFRSWMRDELLKHPTVNVSIDIAYVAAYLNNGSTGTTNEAVLHWGSRAL
ncbi:MAG TPA: hypothetical protein VH063_11225, partial [Gaiellaceae bacterium]|nr:hypothetical protein [Gaiellaceae bacterium]